MGTGVAAAADTVTRALRSVHIDGDGIPDEAQALTVVKGVGAAIAATAGSVGGSVARPFKWKNVRRTDGGRILDRLRRNGREVTPEVSQL